MATSSETPYRVAPPAYQAFQPSAATQAVAGRMNPDDLGATAGLLLGLQGQDNQFAGQYMGQLASNNELQQRLATMHAEQAERESRRKTAVDVMQHGGGTMELLGNDLGLSGTRVPVQEMAARLAMIREQDALANRGRSASAFKDEGAGVQSHAAGGVQVVPGQQLAPGASAQGLARYTTRPQGIEEQQISAGATLGAARTNAAGASGDRMTYTYEPNAPPGDPPRVALQSRSAAGLQALDAAYRAANGRPPPGAPAPGTPAPGGRPQPAPSPMADPRVSAVARTIPDGVRGFEQRGGRIVSVVGNDGKRYPVP